MKMQKLLGLCLGLLALGWSAGCNPGPEMNYDDVELVSAGGTVTLDGQPLANAVVTFESPQSGQFSFGMTDSDGDYSLQFDSEVDGVPPGKKVVRISTTRKILGLNSEEEAGDAMGETEGKPPQAPATELVPEKYNKNSELTVDVTPDQTEYNFELTSK